MSTDARANLKIMALIIYTTFKRNALPAQAQTPPFVVSARTGRKIDALKAHSLQIVPSHQPNQMGDRLFQFISPSFIKFVLLDIHQAPQNPTVGIL